MVRSSLSKNLILTLVLSGLVPFLISTFLLYTWNRSDQKNMILEKHEREIQISSLLKQTLQRVDAVAELLINSRELIDFLLVPQNIRGYSSNLLYGKIVSISTKAPEISAWYIFDNKNNLVFPEGVQEQGHKKEGFEQNGEFISLKKSIVLDDQYQNSGITSFKGYVLVKIPISKLKKSILELVKIVSIPSDLSSTSSIVIETKRALKNHRSLYLIILLLALFMIISISMGVILLYRRVFSPIRLLTQKVKVDGASISASPNEIIQLEESVDSYIETIKIKSHEAAVAKMTQMLAHDVRKPFTMLKGIMDMITNASPEESKKIAKDFVPDVQKSIDSVNGMIADVMEVGSDSKPSQEPTQIESIIENTLNENFRYNKKADIKIKYDLKHAHQLYVDNLKVSRVFSNIIENAIHAMKDKGTLWFKTNENEGVVQITIGNSNSHIPAEDLKQLFETFFTKRKKGGTGLGLAIAKKIVNTHGGQIWCISEQDYGTEFHFTLPITHELKKPQYLPSTSTEIRKAFETMLNHAQKNNPELSKSETELEAEIEKLITRPIKILICDDEGVYRNILKNHIEQSGKIKSKIELIMTENGENAVETAKNFNPDVVIMDVDLGTGLNGFEAVKQIRADGSQCKICIHSNRGAMEYQKNTVEAGADLFMPKPMTRSHLLNIIIGSLPDKPPAKKDSYVEPKYLAVIDDCKIHRFCWSNLKNIKGVKTFETPEKFLEAVKNNPLLMAETKGIVIDQNFEGLSDYTGLEFAAKLREMGFERELYLCSDGEFDKKDLEATKIKKIPKTPGEAIAYL